MNWRDLNLQSHKKLEREWPTLAKEVKEQLLKSSGKAVASGSGTAPKVRSHKRKAYVEDSHEDSDTESATVPSFHPPVQSSASTSESSKLSTNMNPPNTLTAHWATTSKISAKRQAEIDYYLLRFVICCSISFAILDNRFFIDFLTCL